MGKKFLRYVIVFLFVSLSTVVHLVGTRAHSKSSEYSELVEVCSGSIVYVSRSMNRVLCNGEVRRILRFEPYSANLEDCYCPNCCGGRCAVIVSCDPVPEGISASYSDDCGCGSRREINSSQTDLCRLWISCED
jgi:hypothetical protein